MRFVLTSDLHGHLPEVPPCDYLVIAGDLCPIKNHNLDFQIHWLRREFSPWLAAAPARFKVFIAGNHDFVFAYCPDELEDIEWPGVYLQDRGVELGGIHFWGSPWANELPGWPFTAAEDQLASCWSLIPPTTQVLITHGPPFDHGDGVIGSRSGDVLRVGSRGLLEVIDRLPRLRLCVYGHIHEGAGVCERRGVPLINAALMDRHYNPVQPLHLLDLDF